MFKQQRHKIIQHFSRLLVMWILLALANFIGAGDIQLPSRIHSDATMLQAVNQRHSVRSYQTTSVEFSLLSWILQAADQVTFSDRKWGNLLAEIDQSVYQYDSKSNMLKTAAQPVPELRMYSAPVSLYLVSSSGEEKDEVWIWRGMAGQAIYLGASALNLGTVTVRGIGFPVGYAGKPATYEPRDAKNGVIPSLDSMKNVTLESLIFNQKPAGNDRLSEADLLQLFWSVYGYATLQESTGRVHRTVPSAHGRYPMQVFSVQERGLYRYIPDNHTVQKKQEIDVRNRIIPAVNIADVDQIEVMLIFFWDRNQMQSRQMALYEAGAMLYNLELAGEALGFPVQAGLITNSAQIKQALGIEDKAQLEPLLCCAVAGPLSEKTGSYRDGAYYGEAKDWPAIKVKVTIKNGRLSAIDILEDLGTPEFSEKVMGELPGLMIKANGTNVDGISGATLSSEHLKKAVSEALAQAR